jgi:Transglycosylase SLT domain
MSGASARLSWGLALALFMPVIGARADTIQASSVETVQEARCRIVANASHATGLPVGVLTRLIWIESRFKSGATSPTGAQGIAQFMPAMAAKRGLHDPYDPEQAIPHAAKLLIDLEQRFGNIGLATAAYNAGSARVANWLAGSCGLPHTARAYVIALTGRTPEHWAATGRAQLGMDASSQSCIEITRILRDQDGADQAAIYPWGNTPITDVHTYTGQRTEF